MDLKTESVEFGYVGNNYERDQMFLKYYSLPSGALRGGGIQTKVHGNWLQRSPERDSPESLVKRHPNIAFGQRASFQDSMRLLNGFICTVHITKPSYAEMGFASPRYLENIVVGTPALVPQEFKYNSLLGEEWVVSSSVEQLLSGISPHIAVRYQIMVMCMIFSSVGLSSYLFLIMTNPEKS